MRTSRDVRRAVLAAIVAVAASAAFASCGDEVAEVPPAGPPATDIDGSWSLVSGHDVDGGTLDPAGLEVTLDVSAADGEVSGVAACNQYFASFDQDGELIEVSGLGSTEMGCQLAVMDLEARYLSALRAVDHATRDQDGLTLSGPGTELVFAPMPPVPAAELVGTRWVLESLIEDESVSSAMPGGRLVLRGEGILAATTGCGAALGDYTIRGQEVEVSGLDAEIDPAARCTEQAVAQHDHVVAVLEAGFTVKVEGDRLTLTGEDGLGLDFRAR